MGKLSFTRFATFSRYLCENLPFFFPHIGEGEANRRKVEKRQKEKREKEKFYQSLLSLSYYNFCAMGHSAGFGYALWAIAQGLVFRYGP
jgi:hypothetical protein